MCWEKKQRLPPCFGTFSPTFVSLNTEMMQIVSKVQGYVNNETKQTKLPQNNKYALVTGQLCEGFTVVFMTCELFWVSCGL